MPRRQHICSVCSDPCRQGQATITIGTVRHHLACAQRAGLVARGRGRLPNGHVAAYTRLPINVTPEWLERLDAAAAAARVTRTAYVLQAVEERMDREVKHAG